MTDTQMTEWEQRRAESDARLAEFDRQMAEYDRMREEADAKYERRMDRWLAYSRFATYALGFLCIVLYTLVWPWLGVGASIALAAIWAWSESHYRF